MKQKIVIGKFGKPHGIKGWIYLHSFTQPRTNALLYQPWYYRTDHNWQQLELEDSRAQGDSIVVKVRHCDNRDTAHFYTNKELATDREQLPQLDHDDYYWIDLEGLTVINQNDETLGVIDHLIATGANDVMVIKGQQEILIPYLKSVVVTVDLATKTMRVNWDL